MQRRLKADNSAIEFVGFSGRRPAGQNGLFQSEMQARAVHRARAGN
jgi:hypothetical protein